MKEDYLKEYRTKEEAIQIAKGMSEVSLAFPFRTKIVYGHNGDCLDHVQGGLNKREYFAGLAMQGLLHDNDIYSESTLAELSVRYADALIEQLNK